MANAHAHTRISWLLVSGLAMMVLMAMTITGCKECQVSAEGVVLDEGTGEALAGARIDCWQGLNFMGQFFADDQGKFDFRAKSASERSDECSDTRIFIYHSGYEPVGVQLDAADTALQVRLSPCLSTADCLHD